MPSCAFKMCTNNTRNTNKGNGVTFHRFPQEPRIGEKWIRVIQLDQKDDHWLPSDFSRICSVHFKKDDFFLTPLGRRKIKAGAVPSFCPIMEYNQQEESRAGSPLSDVYVSDTDSIFDTPSIIYLKKQLFREKCKIKIIRKENVKLKRQNKNLQSKNNTLQQLLKTMKNKKYLNKEHLNDLDPTPNVSKSDEDEQCEINSDILSSTLDE